MRGRCTTHSGTSGAVILDVRTGSPPEAACRLGLVTTCLAAWVAIVNLRWAPAGPPRPATSGYLTRTTTKRQIIGSRIIRFVRSPGLLEKPSAIVRFLQRRIDVVPKRDRHLRGGGSNPAEPGHGSDRQQDFGDLLVGSARRYRPGGAPFKGNRRRPDGHRCPQAKQRNSPGVQGGSPGRAQPEPGPAFHEAFIDHRKPAQDRLKSVQRVHTAPLAAEPPVHLVPVWPFIPPSDEKMRRQPSSRPSSRDRATASLRVEAPSFR